MQELEYKDLFSVVENTLTGICLFELNKTDIRPVYVNDGFYRMLGYSKADAIKYLKHIKASIIPDDYAVAEQWLVDIRKDDGAVDCEFRTVTASGNIRWLYLRGNLYANEGDISWISAIIADVTERKSMEEELIKQEEQLNMVAASVGEKQIDYNAKTDVLYVKYTEESGRKQEVLVDKYVSKNMRKYVAPEHYEYFKNVIDGLLVSPKKDEAELKSRLFSDDYRWISLHLISITDAEGYVSRIFGRLQDIHENKLKSLEIEIKAEKDGLTGLYNKSATKHLIENALEEEKNRENSEESLCALMMIDLDNFKEVNDYLGHAKGDQVLTDAATEMLALFKGYDIVGRIGGDEFVVFMRNITNISDIDIIVHRLCTKLETTLECSNEEFVHVTASIGISIYPYHGNTYEKLFEKADKALYNTKANGKNGYRIFDAATTLTYHSNRKSDSNAVMEKVTYSKTLEEVCMQIMSENKTNESAIRSVLELISLKYGFEDGRLEVLQDRETQMSYKIVYEPENRIRNRIPESEELDREEAFKALFEKYKAFAVLHRYDDLPEFILREMDKYDFDLIYYYPFVSNGVYNGAISFVGKSINQFKVDEEELRSIIRIMHSYVLHMKYVNIPGVLAGKISILDNISSNLYIVDYNTYEIMFMNRSALIESNDITVGDFCYKKFTGRETPCENCIMRRLNKMDPHSREINEMFNFSSRKMCTYSASWFERDVEDASCIIDFNDISPYIKE